MQRGFFLVLGEFMLAFSILSFTNSTKLGRQLKLTNEDLKVNESEINTESEESSSVNTVNETLFWTFPDIKNTTEGILTEMDDQNIQDIQDLIPEDKGSLEIEENINEQFNNTAPEVIELAISADEPISEEKKNDVHSEVSNNFFQKNKKIILPRNNCNIEIAVHEYSDTKLMIMFGHMQNNSHGRCCITLIGHESTMLGVVISGVHLYHNKTQGEVLKVSVGDHYSPFVLKEYYGWKNYEPLLLTETHKVNLILYYKVENISPNQDCSHFNLEAFNYHKYENNIHPYEGKKDNDNHLIDEHVNYADEVYSAKETSYFTPYFYERVYWN